MDGDFSKNSYSPDSAIEFTDGMIYSKFDFDLQLTKQAVLDMSDGKCIGGIIDYMLEKISCKYGFYHITVAEKKKNMMSLGVTYEYAANGEKSNLSHIICYEESDWNVGYSMLDENNIITCADIDDMPKGNSLFNSIKDAGAKAFALSSLVRSGKEDSVLVALKDAKAAFSDEEISAIRTAAQLISTYLFPLRAYKEGEEEMQKAKLYDQITGLIKYDHFLEAAEKIYKKKLDGRHFAIVYSDIDNFKFFNECYGYSSGDDLLRLFERNLMSQKTEYVTGCRLFSDYFIELVAFKDEMSEELIAKRYEELHMHFAEKVQEFYPQARIGITSGVSIIRDENIGIKLYIDKANLARKKAKAKTDSSTDTVVYDADMDAATRMNVQLEMQAEDALKNGEFYFELQPKIDLLIGKVSGAEALVRWRKKDGSKVYPDSFIPVFERDGFIVKLDYYVYSKVFEYMRDRLAGGKKVVPVSVNVSRVHLDYPNFVQTVVSMVDSYSVPHNLVEFELTESVFIEKLDKAKSTIERLKLDGFTVSMDDFGSGYSSLNLLKELDFDVLKLDKEFLHDSSKGPKDNTMDGKYTIEKRKLMDDTMPELVDLPVNRKEAAIIGNVIRMAKQMDIKVLCEGVETKEQARFLTDVNCDIVQGYYFGRPMLVEDFNYLIEHEKEEIKKLASET